MLTEQIDRGSVWSPVTRTAFRFFALYFLLYVATSRMLGNLVRIPALYRDFVKAILSPWVRFAADRIFHVPVSAAPTGSADRMYDWLQAFCLLTAAIVGCMLWSILDRKRPRYNRIYRWFRVFLRFALGSTLIAYGFEKVFPFQMPAPGLTRLLEPYGNFSPMGVLWSAIGASYPYERFIGMVEVIGGVCLRPSRCSC